MSYDSHGTLNKVMLIGRLGADAGESLKYTPSGAAVITISIATNTTYKDKDGKSQDQTEWNRVVAWRKTAEIIAQYCKKGHRIYVEGKLVTRSWDDKDGNKRYSTEVIVDAFQFLEGKKEGDAADDNYEAPPQSNRADPLPPVVDDPLPF